MENRQIELQIRSDLQRTQTEGLKSLQRLPSNLQGTVRVFFQIATIFALPVVTTLIFRDAIFSTQVFFYFVAGFLMATRIRALALILHDAVHYAICSSRPLNKFLGRVCSLFNFVSFETYTHRHLNHHRFMGNQVYDHDFGYGIQKTLAGIVQKRRLDLKTLKLLMQQFVGSIQIDLLKSREPMFWKAARVTLLALALVFGFYFTSVLGTLAFVIAPMFFFFPALQIFGDYMEHGYLAFQEQGLRTRNHAGVHALVDWILFSNNDQYHLIHHLFPSAPGHALADIHSHLMNESQAYRTATIETRTRGAANE